VEIYCAMPRHPRSISCLSDSLLAGLLAPRPLLVEAGQRAYDFLEEGLG